MATILVVDDAGPIRECTAALLRQRGHVVVMAADGPEALTLAETNPAQLIITDVLMPRMDGFSLAKSIGEIPAHAHTPIIFMTGIFEEPKIRALTRAWGVHRVLIKPIEPSVLLQTVDELLGSSRSGADPSVNFHHEHVRIITEQLSQRIDSLSSRLAAIIEHGLEMSSEQSAGQVLARACQMTSDIVGARATIMFPFNGTEDALDPPLVTGQPPNQSLALIGATLTSAFRGDILLHGRGCRSLHRPTADTENGKSDAPLAECLFVPVRSSSRVYGCMCLIRDSAAAPFGDEEQRVAMLIGAYAGRNHENELLYENLRAESLAHSRTEADLNIANERLTAQNKRLAHLYNSARRFVDDVSHEFRTPLTVIKDFTAILREGIAGPLTSEQQEYLLYVSERTDDLARMVDDLLVLSRHEAGMLDVAFDYRDVAGMLAPVWTTLACKAETARVRLEQDIPDDLPCVYCDAPKIGRVIINLAVNAIKFSKDGGCVRVWARPDDEPGRVRIGITDNGLGIPPNQLHEIFERFKQIEGRISPYASGFGLGLDIARELVHVNMGDIGVSSRQGKGSTFWFTLLTGAPRDILRHYLKHTESPETTAVSVVTAKTDGRTEGELAEEVHRFLQHTLRRGDLLFRTDEAAWIVAVKADRSELDAFFDRIEQARAEANRNRPGRALPPFRFRREAAWRRSDNVDEFLRDLGRGLSGVDTIRIARTDAPVDSRSRAPTGAVLEVAHG